MFAEPVVIMRDEEAKAFKSHSLAIELDFRYYSTIFREEPRLAEWDEPSHFIIACDKSQASISDATRLQTFLEPFRRLHSVASAIITGSADTEYMNDIITSVSAPQVDAHVLIDMATAIEERGDDLVRG